ncbi:MAG: hypothetical protein HY016_01560 [Nitrosomonadales bacterium]|nr:hypothetical protein [Nitrosomonadales bacterium]
MKIHNLTRIISLSTIVLCLNFPVLYAQEIPIVVDHRAVNADAIPQQWLDKARSLKVLFGHQSVGYNILDGLEAMAHNAPRRYQVEIQELSDPEWRSSRNGIGHFEVGENEHPQRKISDFAKRFSSQKVPVDVAMMKLCFVDIEDDNSAPPRVFSDYRDTMEKLEKTYPNTSLIWWTEPLTTSGNAARNEYNRLVREYTFAHNKPLFDIADIESHDPDGKEAKDSSGVVAMYRGYTRDDGHLVKKAQLRVANAWWHLLARLSGWHAV